MTLERIIDMIGSSIGSHLVSRRVEIKKEGPFKGVKTYKIEIWNVEKHCIVESVEETCHLTSENRDSVIESLEYKILEKIFKLCT